MSPRLVPRLAVGAATEPRATRPVARGFRLFSPVETSRVRCAPFATPTRALLGYADALAGPLRARNFSGGQSKPNRSNLHGPVGGRMFAMANLGFKGHAK